MSEEKNVKKFRGPKSESKYRLESSDNDDPLPGRVPSAALLSALAAVGRMSGDKK